MHRLLVSAFTISIAIASLALSACTPDETVGHAELRLTATSPTGQLYRLRHADLTITGPETRAFHTEDDPARSSIDFRVQSGSYTLTVGPGWNLERVRPDGSAQAVNATLLSPTPLPFEIDDEQPTAIVLSFRVGTDVIDFGQGDGSIRIDVDDQPAQPQQIAVSASSILMNEGSTQDLQVSLTQPPVGQAIVEILVNGRGVTVSPSAVAFTAADFAVPQTVHLSAPIDPDAADGAVLLLLVTPGAPATPVQVHITDTDVQGPILTQTSMSIEEGTSAVNGVRLRSRPAAPVTLNLFTDGNVEVTPSMLVFTPDDYDVIQPFSIGTRHDDDTHTDFADVVVMGENFSANLEILILDVDTPVQQRIIVEGNSTTVTEGRSITGGLRLAADPHGILVVHIATSSPALTASTSVITFTSDNWNVAQPVVLTALEDDNTTDENVAVQASADGIPSITVGINVLDNDRN